MRDFYFTQNPCFKDPSNHLIFSNAFLYQCRRHCIFIEKKRYDPVRPQAGSYIVSASLFYKHLNPSDSVLFQSRKDCIFIVLHLFVLYDSKGVEYLLYSFLQMFEFKEFILFFEPFKKIFVLKFYFKLLQQR